MMDLNTYLLYGLFLSRLREQAEAGDAVQRKPLTARAVRFNFVAWTLASLGSTLMKSGRRLKEHYEPRVRTRAQASN